MTSDVVLTAALRSNLLSLQNTQSQIDVTQFRLSTGRKVNSALDNPQSFFASQALNNRASDLTRLLDSIGQSIQTIQAADNGVTALTSLIEQADSVANNAQEALAQGQAEAKITGATDLSGIVDLTPAGGQIVAGDTLVFTVTQDDGSAITVAPDVNGALAATATVTIGANDGIDDLINNINSITLSNLAAVPAATGDQAFEASLDASGNLQVRTLNGGNFNLQFASVAATDGGDLALASGLGFVDQARIANDGTGANNNNIELTAISDVALSSFAFTFTDGVGTEQTAQRSTLINNLNESSTGAPLAAFAGVNAAVDDLTIGINGGTAATIDLTDAANASVSVQNVIDQINNDTSLNTLIEADFDDDTGQLTIRALDATTTSVQIGATASVTANLGFGAAALTGGASTDVENIILGAASGTLATLESDFDRIRDQISELVTNGDTGYRGTNLLNGDNLLTVFNEFRTSSQTTNGVTFTADGLGVDAANFSRTASVDSALAEIRGALEAVRAFGGTLANDLTVIQTRQTFTESTINTLTAGADLLVNADQNEEGAKLLALQTRQQLGVTSLSLASQSQQSILRLF